MQLAILLHKTLEELGDMSTLEADLWAKYMEEQARQSKRKR